MTGRRNVFGAVPGMAPRAPKRNVVVAGSYALVLLLMLFLI